MVARVSGYGAVIIRGRRRDAGIDRTGHWRVCVVPLDSVDRNEPFSCRSNNPFLSLCLTKSHL
eukprot:scaffold146875_cov53-Attheya_sp.AAC.2